MGMSPGHSGAVQTGNPMQEMGCVSSPSPGLGRNATIVDGNCLLTDARRDTGGRGRNQQVEAAEQFDGFLVRVAPYALCLLHPGSGNQRTRNQSRAHRGPKLQ